ncbi:MAG: zinc transporter [Planktomarina sp.]|jgi:zinc transporter
MQVETRPRATGFDNGAIVAPRGMNLNPGDDDEDMVSLRAWVTENTVVTVRRRKLLAVDDIRKTAETGHAPSTSWALLADTVAGLLIRIQRKSIEMEEAMLTFEE